MTRLLTWTGITALTALLSRWLSVVVEVRPRSRAEGPSVGCFPAAAQDEQRLADTPVWRVAEWWLARRALQPLRVRPPMHRLRVLTVDFGPGGVPIALQRVAPLDALVVASDPVPGMAELALHRADRRGLRRMPVFLRAWPYMLPYRDGSFDVVVASGALHGWVDPEAPLAEIRRVLRPDGRYLIADLRRDVPLWLWILTSAVQLIGTPGGLRAMGEPTASVRAAYTPQETEWLAARARLPEITVRSGPAWIMLERSGTSAAPSSPTSGS